MISPTVGRILWYYPGRNPADNNLPRYGQLPFAAVCAYPWSDEQVNVMVVDHAGGTHSRTSVRLIQDSGDLPTDGIGFCTWMPYQLGQAAKVEQVDAVTREQVARLTEQVNALWDELKAGQ